MIKETCLFLASIFVVANPAFAGKPEREMIDELSPRVSETKELAKSTCGCEMAVTVKWDSYPEVKDMGGIYGALGGIQSAVKGYCASAADKKAICDNVSEIEVSMGAAAEVKHAAKKLIVSTNEAYPGDGAFSEVLDKF